MKKNNSHFLGFVFSLMVLTSSFNALAANDTTFHHFFEFKGIPFQADLKQLSDRYELTILGNRPTLKADSSMIGKGGEVNLQVTSFAATSSSSGPRNLSTRFTLDQLRQTLFLLMVSHSDATNLSGPKLLDLLSKDVAFNKEVFHLYESMKSENINVSIRQKSDSVEASKREEIRQINAGHKRTIDSLLNIIDVIDEENRYGGQFEFNDKDSVGIPVYHTSLRGYHHAAYNKAQLKFYPKSVVVKTFNNFIDLIQVDGVVDFNGTLYPTEFYNAEFSIALKHLYQRNQFLAFRIPARPQKDSALASGKKTRKVDLKDSTVDYWTYLVNVSDLIRLNAYKQHFTFMIKNDSYRLSHQDSIVPYQRRSFYDYLNFTTFLDFLGVVEKTPNSLIQIEGRIRVPFRLVNSRFLSGNRYTYPSVFLPKIDAYLNAAFVNGSQADNRVGTVLNQSTNSAELDTLFIDNFDLVRKNNIRTGLEFGFLKTEMKANNLHFYLDYGLHFFRTNLSYTIVNAAEPDIQNRFNVWSWTHGPIFRFEYRPDQNLGMDCSFAVNFKQQLINSDNDNLRVFEVKGPLNKNIPRPSDQITEITGRERTNFKIEFNAYFMVNPVRSNGGLYFRLSNYFNYNFSEIFPQVLVGYSTRLSGMIKNISEKGTKNQ